jgi:molybdenum-dependent DNA-binding transcriptional regulator ModE
MKGGRAGGGAKPTAFGRQLIRTYREFDAEMQACAARRFRPILSRTRKPAAARGPRARVRPLKRH